jgi:thiamine biosynthesis lipoprotein
LLLSLAGCGQPPLYKQEAYVFGTLVEVSVYGENQAKAESAVSQVLANFDALHIALHAWQPGELNSINEAFSRATATAPARVAVTDRWAPTLLPILSEAAALSGRSDGLFNPAIGNLVRLWGFHADTFQPKLPDPAEIDRLVAAQPKMGDIQVEGLNLETRNPTVRLDLGGYAKGYALDLAATTLKHQGIRNALVNIGGNIIALGQHGDRPWRVGIQHPRQGGALATLDLNDGEAIGTSGDYQRFFELDGKRYCHLIDPRTGWPVQHTQAVTVIARGEHAGTLSDVASKPLFIAGPEGWRGMAAKMGISEALRVGADGQIQVTQAMAGRLAWPGRPPALTILP